MRSDVQAAPSYPAMSHACWEQPFRDWYVDWFCCNACHFEGTLREAIAHTVRMQFRVPA